MKANNYDMMKRIEKLESEKILRTSENVSLTIDGNNYQIQQISSKEGYELIRNYF